MSNKAVTQPRSTTMPRGIIPQHSSSLVEMQITLHKLGDGVPLDPPSRRLL